MFVCLSGPFWRTRRRLLSSVCCVVPAAEKLHMAFNLMMVLVDLTGQVGVVVIVCLRGWDDDGPVIVVMDRASGRVWTLMFIIVDCFRVREGGAQDTRWSLRWTDARSRARFQLGELLSLKIGAEYRSNVVLPLAFHAPCDDDGGDAGSGRLCHACLANSALCALHEPLNGVWRI